MMPGKPVLLRRSPLPARLLSSAAAAALILASPGPAAYQAYAQVRSSRARFPSGASPSAPAASLRPNGSSAAAPFLRAGPSLAVAPAVGTGLSLPGRSRLREGALPAVPRAVDGGGSSRFAAAVAPPVSRDGTVPGGGDRVVAAVRPAPAGILAVGASSSAGLDVPAAGSAVFGRESRRQVSGRIERRFQALKSLFSSSVDDPVDAGERGPEIPFERPVRSLDGAGYTWGASPRAVPASLSRPAGPSARSEAGDIRSPGAETPVPLPTAEAALGGGPSGKGEQPAPSGGSSIRWFLAGLLIAQIGVEALGVAMPLLMLERFGGFSAMAQIGVFSSLTGMVGRLAGGAVPREWLKTAYVGASILRLASISVLIVFLMGPTLLPMVAAKTGLAFLASAGAWLAPFYAMGSYAVLVGLYSVNGFLGGISVTTETSLVQAMLGNSRAVLEQFLALEQWLVEIVGVGGPKLGGKVINHFGFGWALAIYPVTFAVAIVLFAVGIRVPRKDAREAADTVRAAAAQAKAGIRDFFKSIGRGAYVVFKNPVMRTAFLGYTAYMILNPFLYSILAPAFGVLMARGDAKLGSEFASSITALYSLGGLVGGIVMWRESVLIQAAKEERDESGRPKDGRVFRSAALRALGRALKPVSSRLWWGMDWAIRRAYLGRWIEAAGENGSLPEAGEKEVLRKSTLLWMGLGTFGLAAFLAFLLPVAQPAYVAIAAFGAAQVIANLKLRTWVMSEASREDQVKVNGFIGAASIGLVAIGLNLMGRLFDSFNGMTPFLYFNGGLALLAATYVWLRWTLKRHSEVPDAKPAGWLRALGAALAVVYGAAAVGIAFWLGHAVYLWLGPVLGRWPFRLWS